jgi:hypothetical protein
MIAIGLWIAAIVVGTVIGTGKGHGLAGFLLSFFLAWFGVVIVMFLPRKHPQQINVNVRHELPPVDDNGYDEPGGDT